MAGFVKTDKEFQRRGIGFSVILLFSSLLNSMFGTVFYFYLEGANILIVFSLLQVKLQGLQLHLLSLMPGL